MSPEKRDDRETVPISVRVLFVDDEVRAWTPLLKAPLRAAGIDLLPEANPEHVLNRITDDQPDVILLDVLFPDLRNKQQQTGREILAEIRKRFSDLPVVMFTTTLADEVYQLSTKDFPGAAFVFSKSIFHEDSEDEISPITSLIDCLVQASESLRRKVRIEKKLEFIVGNTQAMQTLADYLVRIAVTNVPVLIYGESGTGKELVANSLQALSDRATEPFVKVNCGALSDETLESTLFGHQKGAFTGAQEAHKGLFEQADRGTLFLDEVQTMSPRLQQSLLRAIQEGVVRQMGAVNDRNVDVRVIAAANEDLQEFVDDGKFRADLFYRLDRAKLTVPPLRERKADIAELFESLVGQANQKHGKAVSKVCRGDLLRLFESHDWPGNIRELQSLVETAVAVSKANVLTPQDFATLPSKRSARSLSDEFDASVLATDINWKKLREIKGEQRRSILLGHLRSVKSITGKRPTSAQLARDMGTSPGNVRRILHESGIRLKDFDRR